MGFHATIGNSNTRAPRVRATDKRYTSMPLTLGRDVTTVLIAANGLPVRDRRGHMGATTPASAPYDIASDALGTTFESTMARSIVIAGEWRKADSGWAIRTQLGMLKVIRGVVTLNGETLGRVNAKTVASQRGRSDIITKVIAGTLAL